MGLALHVREQTLHSLFLRLPSPTLGVRPAARVLAVVVSRHRAPPLPPAATKEFCTKRGSPAEARLRESVPSESHARTPLRSHHPPEKVCGAPEQTTTCPAKNCRDLGLLAAAAAVA
ncbi:unnamed protein product, partial [Ixodes pacificus]